MHGFLYMRSGISSKRNLPEGYVVLKIEVFDGLIRAKCIYPSFRCNADIFLSGSTVPVIDRAKLRI